MPKTNNSRIHLTWWVLGIALLLAWQYWPSDTTPVQTPSIASTSTTSHAPAPLPPAPSSSQSIPSAHMPASLSAFLPVQARKTIALIQRGGPFPHQQDGNVFGNREGRLSRQPHGWYHEYTVDTPGLSHRGARRIITGGNPPRTWHYTSDHYDSFRDFNPGTGSGIPP